MRARSSDSDVLRCRRPCVMCTSVWPWLLETSCVLLSLTAVASCIQTGLSPSRNSRGMLELKLDLLHFPHVLWHVHMDSDWLYELFTLPKPRGLYNYNALFPLVLYKVPGALSTHSLTHRTPDGQVTSHKNRNAYQSAIIAPQTSSWWACPALLSSVCPASTFALVWGN